MSLLRIVMLTIAAVSVSACSNSQMTARNVSATEVIAPAQRVATDQIAMPNARIENITVVVPETLRVSEANAYYPNGDIIWRGDTMGNRHAQVKAILEESAKRMAASLEGTRPVNLQIELTRFHGLSEKARYSTGGVHNINFYVTLTDPATGTILRGPRHVVTNLDALGGSLAIEADKRGETQKVRITAFLAQVLRDEMTKQGGYVDTNSGFFVALNRAN